ncbi:hmg-i hmg- dna-binding protein [Ophiostoma piceae UAMH 11346]|uniref:Hmg-i hmg-dna-binding protein n=1 Tax=Ophiostoma piceae (strain UAMH 11346) TaxID=1262450 RepID=S3C2Y4_OPHP1|nr:hmg-i hmg- dna-binding protein [Ophiostoma piceae UAMH 11346]
MTTKAASAVSPPPPPAAAANPTTSPTAPFKPSSFTPLESFFLFQSILQYGVEPESFVRIAVVLQNNAFIRSDESFNAARLTAESLRQFFLYLLEEIARERKLRGIESEDLKRAKEAKEGVKADDVHLKPIGDKIPPEQLPLLVEHLYARYREHIVDAIREDERRIERVQGEIRTLEQQASGGGGRGAHARAVAAAAAARANNDAAAAAAGRQAHAQAQLQAQAHAHAQAQANAHAHAHAQAQAAQAAQAQQQQTAQRTATPSSGPVPILPATSRPSTTQPSPTTGPSPPTSARATASPTLQQQQQQQQQLQQQLQNIQQQQQQQLQPPSSRTPPLLVPHPPTTTTTTTTQSLSRTPSTVGDSTSANAPVPAPTAGGRPLAAAPSSLTPPVQQVQAGGSPQPGSRPISPAVPHNLQPSAKQQSIFPTTVKPAATAPTSQVSSKAQTPLSYAVTAATAPGTPAAHTPRTLTPAPSSPLKAPSAAGAAGQAPQALQATAQPADRVAETPRPLASAAQKQTPLAPGSQVPLQFQRTPAPGAGALTQPVVGRPLLPEHVRGGPPSRTPTPVQSPRPFLPHTPVHAGIGAAASFIPRGSGTRWKPSEPTPSTPGPDVGDMASPAYEPLSPMQPNTVSASRAGSADVDADASASPSGTRSRTRRPTQTQNTRPVRSRPSRHSRSQAGDNTDDDGASFAIKAEASTPKAFDDDTMDVDELSADVDAPISSRLKRKRGEDDVNNDNDEDDAEDDGHNENTVTESVEPKPDLMTLARRRLVGPSTPPTHVLWMRGFPKISASALDQISSHRHANMFAHKIRDRDAPGYGSIVRHPVDLKSIRMAITQGNKAATQAAAALLESAEASDDTATLASLAPDMGSVWLPISEDLVPPRGIINSSQLESELVHMFANAVMYNPDSHRGPGPAFVLRDGEDEDEWGEGNDNARYEVDEDGVVNDTRDMYVEVEKLLSEMRSAERQRGLPVPPSGARGLDLPLDDNVLAEAMGMEPNISSKERDDVDEPEKDDKDGKEDEAAADAADEGSGTIKRRRLTRGQ